MSTTFADVFDVASFTGAWVETALVALGAAQLASHPLRVRGLKHILLLS